MFFPTRQMLLILIYTLSYKKYQVFSSIMYDFPTKQKWTFRTVYAEDLTL